MTQTSLIPRLLPLLALLACRPSDAAPDAVPASHPAIVFAGAADARRILTARDDFIASLSPFDRAARLRTDRQVTEKEFTEFVGGQTLDWTPEETQKVAAAFATIAPRLAGLLPGLPSPIVLVKTTGREEGGTAYTRARAVVLPAPVLDGPGSQLPKLLAHEAFHIATRADPALRHRSYAAIGFVPCEEPVFPDPLKPRKITNPDAPGNDHCILVKVEGRPVWTVPILFSRTDRYDSERGGEFFTYLTFGLLSVPGPASTNSSPPRAVKQEMFAIGSVAGFYEQVGDNTQYIIHPEEILADNFSMLVLGTTPVPSPAVLERLAAALAPRQPGP